MDMTVLIDKMIIFLVLMVIGYLLARKGILDKGFIKSASWLTLNVFMVATIINSAIHLDTEMSLAVLGKLLLAVFVMQALGYAAAAIVARVVPIDAARAPGFELLMSMGNTIFIALPIVEGLYGAVAVFYVALSCIPFNVLLYSYGVMRLKGGGDGKLRLKDMFSIPLIATLLSVLLVFLRLPMPAVLQALLNSMSGATMPMSMMVIGASMGSVSLLAAFRDWHHYVASLVRLILVPLLTWLVLGRITSDPVLLMTMVIVAACPSAVLVTVMSVQYDRDAVFTAAGTLQNTALSILTIPLLIYFLS